MIEISDIDTKTLRLFLLSVFWRCAASTRVQFAEIFLPPVQLEYLRKIVTGESEPKDSDWPTVLLLLTTKGEPQILGPIAQEIDMKSVGFDLPSVPIFRFFFDGLIAHIGRKPADENLLNNWKGRVVGTTDNLLLIGRPYEKSSQEDNLYHLQYEMFREHPENANKVYRALEKIDQKGHP